MGLTDMLSSAARGHTGLHYVPSFNDFVSNAADDCEAIELDREMKRDQQPRVGNMPKPMTNKTDDLPAMTSAVGDIHKVNRPIAGGGRADWIIDNARGGRHAPSVWQFILQSQGKEALPKFDDMVAPRQTTLGPSDLQKHLNVTPSQAQAMVAEADRNNDNRIDRFEFDNMMSSA